MAEATARPEDYDPSDLHLRFIDRRGEKVPVLAEPVAFFIPEHIPDPSRRQEGEELWVEVTIPKKGPPRPDPFGCEKRRRPDHSTGDKIELSESAAFVRIYTCKFSLLADQSQNRSVRRRSAKLLPLTSNRPSHISV